MKRLSKCAAAAMALALLLTGCAESFYDEKAEAGLLSSRTDEEVAELQAQEVDEGMLQVSINTKPVFLSGASEGNLRIENAPGNTYDLRVTITLKDSGAVVYRSGGIKPNQHIENDTLDVPLAEGEYEAVAKFYAVDKNHKDVGVVAYDLTLTVMS